MAMDMLEHESVGSVSSIAGRGTSTIISLGDDGTNEELTKSFLIKRMEIDYFGAAGIQTDDATGPVTAPYYLMFHKTSVANDIDTIAEQLNARMEDKNAHQQIIWRRQYFCRNHVIDDADNTNYTGSDVVFKTSKSFSKGFRLDKDETYVWVIFNPSSVAVTAQVTVSFTCRYWGVYIE